MNFRSWMIAVTLVGLTACGGEEQGERVELGEQQEQEARPTARDNWSPELTAQIDSANAAYAAGEYQTAADVFTTVTDENPELGVAWFGLYMAEKALGNEEEAREALVQAEEFAPGLGLMHQAATDTSRKVPLQMEGHPQMPAGHPSVDSGPMQAPPLDESGQPEQTGGSPH